jgi:hypothetical protein
MLKNVGQPTSLSAFLTIHEKCVKSISNIHANNIKTNKEKQSAIIDAYLRPVYYKQNGYGWLTEATLS